MHYSNFLVNLRGRYKFQHRGSPQANVNFIKVNFKNAFIRGDLEVFLRSNFSLKTIYVFY